jgi:hypothetical protein
MKRIVAPVMIGLLIALPAWSRDVHALGLRAFQEVSNSYFVAFVDRMGATLGCWSRTARRQESGFSGLLMRPPDALDCFAFRG